MRVRTAGYDSPHTGLSLGDCAGCFGLGTLKTCPSPLFQKGRNSEGARGVFSSSVGGASVAKFWEMGSSGWRKKIVTTPDRKSVTKNDGTEENERLSCAR